MNIASQPNSFAPYRFLLFIVGVFIVAAAAVAVPVYSVRSGSSPTQPSGNSKSSPASTGQGPIDLLTASHLGSFSLLSTNFQTVPPDIATYDSTCTIPRTTFALGETVCAIAVNQTGFRFAWVDPVGFNRARTDITTSPQTDTFTLPSTTTSVVNGTTVDNRGEWRVNIITSRGSTRRSAFFTVTDPQNPAVDLSIFKTNISSESPAAGDAVQFEVTIKNLGPNDAVNVHFVDDTFTSATFNSVAQTSGPPSTCSGTGGADCTIALFPKGEVAKFTLNFTAGAAGGTINNKATVSSDTLETNESDNSSESVPMTIRSGASTTCVLECPSDIVTNADTTEGGQRGAHVDYNPPVASGTCGTVTSTPASGSFFPVGTTTVTATSETGGGTCSFTVTVTEDTGGGPTITCPSNKDATAAPGACSAAVDPGTPTATGSNVTVSGERSDGEALDAPYPGGTTTIVWTATDDQERTATCSQTVTVHTDDTTPPTVTAPDDVTVSTGTEAQSCGQIVGESELGTPTGSDNCGSVSIKRTGVPAGNFFPVGTTTITYTATDGGGNTATDTQTVTVTDDAFPTVTATAPNPNPPPATEDVPIQNVTVHTGANSTSCDAVVSDADLGNVQARDNCAVTLSRSPSGNTFPVGTTTITWTATDASGNQGTAMQTVTVIDDTQPTITAPADVTANTGAGRTTCDANISDAALGSPSANDNCTFTVSRSPSGNTFPVGTTTVTWTVTDASGNTNTDTQEVTVTDTTAPAFTATAADSSASADASCQAPVPDYTASSAASDNCGGTVTITQSPAAGTMVGTGPHTVTVTATDSVGNSSTDDVVFTVNDTTDPTVTAPADSSASADANCQAPVPNYAANSTASDNCDNSVTLTQSPAAGTLVTLGAHTVTVTATDDAGNDSSDTVVFTVNDTTAPTVTAPADSSASADANCQAPVPNYAAASTASDNCDSSVTFTQSPAAGTMVGKGPHTVTVTGTDDAGNYSSDTVVFTVNDTTAPVITCPANITRSNDPGMCSANVNPGTATATDNCDSPTISGSRSDNQPLNAPYPVGTTTITWTARDSSNNSSSCSQTITVNDTEAPTITTNGQTPVLWPANHAYHTFNVTDFVTGVNDNCGGSINVSNVTIQLVTSDELENGGGSGNTTNDIVIAENCKSVQLRAERENAGDGRVYTITFRVTDSAGNVGTKTSKVHVPKNLGVPVVDSGPHYAVAGTCP